VIGPDGSLKPITSLQFLVGAVGHPIDGTDVYAYYGQDQTQANAWTVAVLRAVGAIPHSLNLAAC
jgi:hypothetical protein